MAEPNKTTPTMSGAELIGRLVAVEGFAMVLAEAWLDRPDIDEATAQAMLAKMGESAKKLAAQLGHAGAQSLAEKYADEMVKTLSANLAAMRDNRPG